MNGGTENPESQPNMGGRNMNNDGLSYGNNQGKHDATIVKLLNTTRIWFRLGKWKPTTLL